MKIRKNLGTARLALLLTAVTAVCGCVFGSSQDTATLLAQARTFAKAEDYSAAAGYYIDAWEAKKGTREGEKIFLEAGLVFKKGVSYKRAYRLHKDFVDSHPESKYAAQALRIVFETVIEHAESGWGQQKLTKLIEEFPAAPLASEAQFKLGSRHFGKSRYEEATDTFESLITNYPESERVEAAMFMIAEAHLRSYEGIEYEDAPLEDAKAQFEILLSSYPSGAYSVRARKRIRSIEKELARRDYLMAQYYMRHGKPASARVYLEAVLKQHPDTEYAKLAKKMLSKVPEREKSEK